MENFNKENYLKALDKIKEKKEEVEKLQEEISKINELIIDPSHRAIESQFDNSNFNEEVFEIDNTLVYIKSVKKNVDTEGVFLDMQTELLDKFGDDGMEMFITAEQDGTTTKKTFNRTKLLKSLRDQAKVKGYTLTELIKAVEEDNSEKTIKYTLKDVKEGN